MTNERADAINAPAPPSVQSSFRPYPEGTCRSAVAAHPFRLRGRLIGVPDGAGPSAGGSPHGRKQLTQILQLALERGQSLRDRAGGNSARRIRHLQSIIRIISGRVHSGRSRLRHGLRRIRHVFRHLLRRRRRHLRLHHRPAVLHVTGSPAQFRRLHRFHPLGRAGIFGLITGNRRSALFLRPGCQLLSGIRAPLAESPLRRGGEHIRIRLAGFLLRLVPFRRNGMEPLMTRQSR